MNEVWQPIPGYEGFYEASDQGRVRSLDRWVKTRNRWGECGYWAKGQVLLQHPGKEGHPTVGRMFVCLSKEGKGKPSYVHTLIAFAFLGPRPKGLHIDHVNGDKADNRACNLEYVTPQENTRRARAMGMTGGGERSPSTGRYVAEVDSV